MSYRIVRYDPQYNDQICELEKENWSPDLGMNRSYLRWKYFENPFSDSPKLYIALLDGKVIALRGMYESRWQLGNCRESFTALCAGDLVIHREYRNKGIHTELMKFIRDDLYGSGYRYLLSLSAGPANLINSLAMGWKSIGRIKVIGKKLNPRSRFTKLVGSDTLNKVISRVKATRLKSPPETGFDSIEEIKYRKNAPPQIRIGKEPLANEMASLVKNLCPDNKLILARDEEFFRWRYRNPLSAYFFLYWYEGGLRGYAVAQTSVYKRDMNFNVLELEALDSPIKIEILKALLSLRGIRSISIWPSMLDEDCLRYLSSAGFSETGAKGGVAGFTQTILVWTTYGSNDKIEYRGVDLTDISNWDLKMVYSDAL